MLRADRRLFIFWSSDDNQGAGAYDFPGRLRPDHHGADIHLRAGVFSALALEAYGRRSAAAVSPGAAAASGDDRRARKKNAAARRIANIGGSGPAAFTLGTANRWAGETVACIASGPSLKQSDVDHLRGKCRCIAINTSFRAAPWADALYACDNTWWQQYFPEAATGFKGAEMWTCAPAARNQFKIYFVYGARHRGLSKKSGEINTGLNSGYQAIGLAHMWGAKKILLLGYDFQRTAGRVHWHPDHPRKLGNGGRFTDWVAEMHYLASDALTLGLEIINCSRQTALRCFPRSTIQEQLP